MICIQSVQQEIRQFYALADRALYLGLCKTALLYSPEAFQYRLFCCHSRDSIPSRAVSADFRIYYFLCSAQEIADFFSANFRNMGQALFLLNSSHYHTPRDLFHFQKLYRLPAFSIRTVSSNLAFQAAISNNQENHFFHFYQKKKLCNQNYDFLEQLKAIHFLTAAYMNGELLWNTTNYSQN